MKTKAFLTIILLGIMITCNAQIKYLNDPSIVAHHKRMVYESWGDWRPYPKYFLGIQTNFAYATVWGNWAPSRNRKYKRGDDIRPLKVDGLEVKRYLELEIQRKEAEIIFENVDTLYRRALQDYAHWTSLTVEADPLWQLYYKRMLRPLTNFPSNPQNHIQWGIDKEVYDKMKANGAIPRMKEQLDLLKYNLKISRTIDMPRGKRFLLYHETLMGWRKLQKEIRGESYKTNVYLGYNQLFKEMEKEKKQIVLLNLNDKAIVTSVMNQYKHKF